MGIIESGRNRHLRSQGDYAAAIEQAFLDVGKKFFDMTKGAERTKFASSFRFDEMPKLNKQLTGLFDQFNDRVYGLTASGISASWDIANQTTDMMLKLYVGKAEEVKKLPLKYLDHNQEALKAFIERKDDAGSLSSRVWSNSQQYRNELEVQLGLGILNGDSASVMSRRIRPYLNDPTALFRRVRNDSGNLVLSKRAKEYESGQGRYRSAYKNAMRVTRTETNMAYRSADHERWIDMDFILGVEVHLSNQHPIYDICDEMEGNYPKDFRFLGWHPQCFCFAVPILMKKDEFIKYLNGEEFEQPQYVTEVPKAFTNFMDKYGEQIDGWSSKPYWLRDNESIIAKGSQFEKMQPLKQIT